jgi:hypothetical protein
MDGRDPRQPRGDGRENTMLRYATHAFANRDTLLRAVRWLMLLGFDPGEIEVNTEGVHRVSVLASSGQSMSTALRVFEAAEHTDPEGWPSFWDLSLRPFVHQEIAQANIPVPPPRYHQTPVGWHPDDVRLLLS